MLDGHLDGPEDHAEHVRALKRTAARTVWIPMSEYLDPDGIEAYRAFDVIASPTLRAHEMLKSWGLPSRPIHWAVEPAPLLRGNPYRLLHFAYGDRDGHKSGTDLVFGAWPELQDRGFELTVKARGSLAAPPGVNVVSEHLDSLKPLWSEHGVLVQPYRRCGLGLPVLEALARGIPAVVSRGTTVADRVPGTWCAESEPGARYRATTEREARPEDLVDTVCAARDGGEVAAQAHTNQKGRYGAWRDRWREVLSREPAHA